VHLVVYLKRKEVIAFAFHDFVTEISDVR